MMKIRMRRAARQKAENGLPKWRRAFGYLATPTNPTRHRAAGRAGVRGDPGRVVARRHLPVNETMLARSPSTATVDPTQMSLPAQATQRRSAQPHPDGITEIVGKGTWPPLVDESTWRAAQAVLDAPGRAPGRKSVRRHLLTGCWAAARGCGGYLSGQWTIQKSTSTGSPAIAYACKQCRGVSIRAEHVEPLIIGLIGGRLAKPDALICSRPNCTTRPRPRRCGIEVNTLNGTGQIGIERGRGPADRKQAKIASDVVAAKIEAIDRKQQDQPRSPPVRTGLPLAHPRSPPQSRH